MAESKATIDATNLRVYPCSTRADKNDLNAKLNSEQNIVSVINRLTNNSLAFVIGDLKFESSDTGLVIHPFNLNIFGYLFKVLSDINFTSSAITNKTKIIAYIKTETIQVDDTDFEQLKPSIEVKTTDMNNLDSQPFKPLTISAVTDTEYANLIKDTGVKCLILLQGSDNTWSLSPFVNIPFRSQDIGIDITSDNIIDSKYKSKSSLSDWLVNNYTIDDGELN